MGNQTFERVDFVSHRHQPAKVVASFIWSDSTGLLATKRSLIEELEKGGILVPPDEERVFPSDGRRCFDALKWRATTFVEVTPARKVDSDEVGSLELYPKRD